MIIYISKREKRIFELQVDEKITVSDLKKKIQEKSRISVERQSLKTNDARMIRLNDDRLKLSEYGIKEGTEINVTDIGPQVGYRTVFICEYFGPLAIMLIFLARPSFIYEKYPYAFSYQSLIFVFMWIFHYAKRLFESVFIHKFSRSTMPLMNIVKNSVYYWGFAVLISYVLCHPLYTPTSLTLAKVSAVCMFITEFCNGYVHYQFKTMKKKDGDQTHPIPYGIFFYFVSCPNYTFEVLSWVAFSIGSNIFMGYVFTIAGFLQMMSWALKKHKAYMDNYKEYKGLRRKSIVPFII